MGTPVKRASESVSRPSFCKTMVQANLYDLRIPPDFKEHLATEFTDKATLKTPCGSWEVRVIEHEGDMYLSHGWQKFVKRHNLTNLENLVFHYNGRMHFDVEIYESSGCKRIYREPGSSFTSRYPYFKSRVGKCNIGSKAILTIPRDFQNKHFNISERTSVVLRSPNPDGFSWLVTVTVQYNREKKQLLMSQGWKKFADDNSLKKGDTCIFELVKGDVMQVHIFRST